jgi:hypothetical protein
MGNYLLVEEWMRAQGLGIGKFIYLNISKQILDA